MRTGQSPAGTARTREATRPPSRGLLGSDPAQPENESSQRPRRGRSPARGGGRGGERACPHPPPASRGPPTLPGLHLSPPPLPRPPRLSGARLTHALETFPAVPPPLEPPSPPRSPPPRAPLQPRSPRPWLLPRRAGPSPRVSPASRPQARPLLPLPTPVSATFPLLPLESELLPNQGLCLLSRFPGSHPRLSFPGAAAAAGAGSRERRRRRRGPGKAPGRREEGGCGRRQGGGKSGGDGERAPPTTRAPGAAPDPGPALDRPQRRGAGGGLRRGRSWCTRGHGGDPRARLLGTGVPASEAEKLALRQGTWEAGGERR